METLLPELQDCIVLQLPVRAFLNFTAVCQKYAKFNTQSNWRNLLRQDFNDIPKHLRISRTLASQVYREYYKLSRQCCHQYRLTKARCSRPSNIRWGYCPKHVMHNMTMHDLIKKQIYVPGIFGVIYPPNLVITYNNSIVLMGMMVNGQVIKPNEIALKEAKRLGIL